jgi:predicted ATP-grasp superfamily ATP-dependent carboligase
LLGGTETSLAVARSIGQAAIPVTILGDGLSDIVARRSRYCKHYEHFSVPPSGSAPPVRERWLEWLLSLRQPSVILPCSDEGLELVARQRELLVDAGHLPIEGNGSVMLAMLDKVKTYRMASALGIGVPRTVQVTSLEGADEFCSSRIDFPCAIKPARSDLLMRDLPDYAHPKGALVRDRRELAQAVEPIVSVGLPVLVTEFIPGRDDQFCSYYSYLDEEGRPLLHFTKRKLRQFPPVFGNGTYHVTEWQPDVAEIGLRFFQGVGLRGFGNVEFKRDRRDGQLKLIECNARFTMSTSQVRRAGIDLPLLAYNRLTGRPLPPLDSFRNGVRLWFPSLDFLSFRQYHAAGELSTMKWLSSLAHRQHLPVFDWRDPMPFLSALRRHFRSGSRPGSESRRSTDPQSGLPHET